MIRPHKTALATLCSLLVLGAAAHAAMPDEAAQLKTTLTPLGGERAGNKDGTIPAWDGGYTKAIPGFANGGKRGDPFANEKPLYTITAKNAAQYADKLTDGVKAMLKKHPDTFRLDVYPTHRTAAAPQWVYDNTFKNATSGKLNGMVPEGVYGGVPFPIPKNGAEAMWNHLLRWRGSDWHADFRGIQVTADGKQVTTVDGRGDFQMPYYFKDGSAGNYNGEYWLIRLVNAGPPIRAGEAIVGRENLNPERTQAWVYLTGQRRVRKLPIACCDTPTPATAGIMSFDEVDVFNGRLDRFDWKLVGKKEIYIPYNSNKMLQPKIADLIGEHHLNPDYVRWELHRVWVVEANLAPGKRHQAPKGRYYLDEDTWAAVLGDRWDANGQLWKTMFANPIVMPDLPATAPPQEFGFYDLVSGAWYVNGVLNEKAEQYKIMPRYGNTVFTPEAMAGEGQR
ncbi:DUF1329 domain-containing protein [Massilia putida]|uniref:DUF1329 domain-containing protein n=1 Tax=Massilia putida TaxID=1141883 RepID=UPI0009526BFB